MGDERNDRRVTRRGFIERSGALGAGAAVAPLVLKLAGCGDGGGDASDMDDGGDAGLASGHAGSESADAGGGLAAEHASTDASPLPRGGVLLGLHEGDVAAGVAAALRHMDLSWLDEGDSVLIKVASNSGNPHPGTTSPAGVRALVAELKQRGAGRVIVADQAGVEWVRKTESGRFSSTRERFESNGLIELEQDAELSFFDDGEWDDGYFEATLPEGHRWPRGLRIASIVRDVDHIIYMPRISAHTLAGLTHGLKSAIGFLRDDSRHDLHNDVVDFYEKYAEVSHVEEIGSRFRMVMTVGEKVQLFGGPDEGTEYEMDPPLVLASDSLASHDAVAASLLVTLQNVSGAAPSGMTYSAATASLFNGFFASGTGVGGTTGEAGPWMSESPSTSYTVHGFETGVGGERAVARAWELSGGRPERVAVLVSGESLDADVQAGLVQHGEGIYDFV